VDLNTIKQYLESKVQEVFLKLNDLQMNFELQFSSPVKQKPSETNYIQDLLSDSLASITDKDAIVQYLI
jgi:hypothetical protein